MSQTGAFFFNCRIPSLFVAMSQAGAFFFKYDRFVTEKS